MAMRTLAHRVQQHLPADSVPSVSSGRGAARDVGPYWIPSHVRACSGAAGTVLLDLKRNRYFSVGARETRALFTLALNWSDVQSLQSHALEPLAPETAVCVAEALVDAGLLSRDAPEQDAIAPGCVSLDGTLASVGHELDRSGSMQFGHVIDYLGACTWAKRALRSRSLHSVACEVSRNKACAPEYFDEERAIELVGIFRRLRAYTFGTQGRCLLHALALLNFLYRYELCPAWVIGVRTTPWAAHSWVQQGPLILDDTPEHVCEYTPILVV